MERPHRMKESKLFIPERFDEDQKREERLTVGKEALLPVTITKEKSESPISEYVSARHYSNFNFLRLSNAFSLKKTTIGITSANRHDGKTMVAVNMAISLARGYQQKTLLIDFNFQNPQLHHVFDAPLGPGLADAMDQKLIKVRPTPEPNLYLMTAGHTKEINPGIEHTLVLRNILQTLKEEFEFIVIDMTSILPINEFPVHFINEVDGLISVIDTTRTKKTEFNKIFKHLDEHRFMGYVFNKVKK